jgi:hypothetical protein
LDTGFGGDGIVTTAIGAANDYALFGDSSRQMASWWWRGSSWNGSDSDVALVRYNADGSFGYWL